MNFELRCLKYKVYHAAHVGMPMALCEHLKNLSEIDSNILLSQICEENGQKCSPLLIASRNGHEKAVRVLLKYKPDLEQEGTVKFDGYVIDGASPLWCAAGAGHLNVVKMLVRAGADVNHPTKTNSTPLRAACFDGRLDIVQYLTVHHANIHIANKYNNTCLMIAAYKGHVDIVNFLLDLGANTDENAHCGATALHFAAECGHVDIVKALIEKGASICTNEHGMTPLTSAAERTRANVVEYFVSLQSTTKKEKIDSYELLGASFACDKDNYNIELAFKYIMMGMRVRFSDQDSFCDKPETPQIVAYDNHIECKTIEELTAFEHRIQELHMESLVIRERILGTRNPEVPHPVIYRGAVFADNARFDRCLQLWIHALHLKQSNNVCVVKDLLRFAQVFSQMLHVGVKLEFEDVREVLASTVIELERTYGKTKKINPKDDVEVVKEEIECMMVTSLYLIMICIRVLKDIRGPLAVSNKIEFRIGADYNSRLDRASNGEAGKEQSEEYKEKESKIHCLVYKLLRIGARNKSGKTLLHLSVNPDTPVDDFHTNDICRFPCSSTTKLLISCGADVNEMDYGRNTPLHLIVPYTKHISDFLTLHNIIIALIDAGAHMDTVNQSGATPMEAATTGVAEIILRTQNKISLKCQAARVIKRTEIPYKGHVPVHLEHFIELHGPCHVDSLITASEKESVRKQVL